MAIVDLGLASYDKMWHVLLQCWIIANRCNISKVGSRLMLGDIGLSHQVVIG